MSGKDAEKTLPRVSIDDWSKIVSFISNHNSFVVCDAANTSNVAQKIEKAVEDNGLRCRVRTSHRAAGLAAALVPNVIGQVAGISTAVGILAHNIVTYNPDYEIIKCPWNDTIEVMYQK